MFEVIHQTRETVFHHYILETENRVENTTRSGVFLTKFDETLSRVFNVPSQSKQKLRSKWRSKIFKIYAN